MKKYILDLTVTENERLHNHYVLLKCSCDGPLPEMLPGQFVEIKIEKSPTTFLRRPISINFVDYAKNELWLLIQIVGKGTETLADISIGETLNIVLPLGNSFTEPKNLSDRILLIGGGVGTAPMLFLGHRLKEKGYMPQFLLGARSATDIMQLDDFKAIGPVAITTEDGSLGEKGYVTQHSLLEQNKFDIIYTCGPKPMMIAVASYARKNDIRCEASLENMMACGIGACLCCVEKTTEGHLCVCKEGPVFNIDRLTWQI